MEEEHKYEIEGTSYTIRGLKHSELKAWADFCASVFAYKRNPPPSSYFLRHFLADPDRQSSSWIRVALLGGKQIVASCRVFFRRVSAVNTVLTGAGIGEVCTDIAHRRRGLSTQLLQDAFSIMERDSISFDFSFLHASATFFNVYRSAGYTVNAKSRWYTPLVDSNILTAQATQTAHCFSIRMAQFPHDADQLMYIHRVYSEQRVRGTIVRSRDYWVDYVSGELKGSLYLLCDKQREEDKIIGWLSLRRRDDDGAITKLQLKEFGCADPIKNCYSVLVQLVRYAVVELSKEAEITSQFRLQLPKLVCEDAEQSCIGESFLSDIREEDDHGWMYKPLANPDLVDQVVDPDSHHLIWPTDSF
jgi:hypothetical protein